GVEDVAMPIHRERWIAERERHIRADGRYEAARPRRAAIVRDGVAAEQQLREKQSGSWEELPFRAGRTVVADDYVPAVGHHRGFTLRGEFEGPCIHDRRVERRDVVERRIVHLAVDVDAVVAPFARRELTTDRAALDRHRSVLDRGLQPARQLT